MGGAAARARRHQPGKGISNTALACFPHMPVLTQNLQRGLPNRRRECPVPARKFCPGNRRPSSAHSRLRNGCTRPSWVVGDTMGIPFPSIPIHIQVSQRELAGEPRVTGLRCRGEGQGTREGWASKEKSLGILYCFHVCLIQLACATLSPLGRSPTLGTCSPHPCSKLIDWRNEKGT